MCNSISPYRMVDDAIKLIDSMKDVFSVDKERLVIILLNTADSNLKMSKYQLSLSRKALGDCYHRHGITQNAIEQYELGLELNPNLPVKKKLKELYAIDSNNRVSSLNYNMVGNISEYYGEVSGESISSRASANNNGIYDEDFEKMLTARLQKMGEPYISEFYKTRINRKPDAVFSDNERDLMTLEAMERSLRYNKRAIEVI